METSVLGNEYDIAGLFIDLSEALHVIKHSSLIAKKDT